MVHEVSRGDDRGEHGPWRAASLIPCSSFVGEDDGTVRRHVSRQRAQPALTDRRPRAAQLSEAAIKAA